MNKFSLIIITVLMFTASVWAQVDNYALKLTSGGTVSSPQSMDIDNLQAYTVQLWMNPAVWTPGAVLFERGAGSERFAAELGDANTVQFIAGDAHVNVSSNDLTANAWNQLTFVYDNGQVKVYLNNVLLDSPVVDMAIPVSQEGIQMGGNGFEGQLDEFRMWTTAIEDPFFHLWRNTVNKHHPNYENLLVYYKFDQNLCANVVDYRFNCHGVFSNTGAERILVADNPHFKYRRSVAYSDFGRWADRQIDKDKYLLSNDLILLTLDVDASGNMTIPQPYNEGTVSNGTYMAEYQGRNGVLSLNGAGAKMDVGVDVLNPASQYSFSTWIYLEEWTEGAYIFKKEKSDTEGFSIRLGDEAKKRILVRVNGVDYSRINYMKVGEWIHLGVAAYSTTKNQVFQTTFNGETSYAVNNDIEVNSYTLSGLENTAATIGEGLNAKFDETVVWNAYRSPDNMAAAMTDTPMPSDTRLVEAQTLFTFDSYWNYDKADNVGYDSYSYKHFISIMRDHYKGYRGFMIRGGVRSFNGWESAFGNPTFRATFASEVARVTQEFDGIDLDFEWCYDGGCWDNYGKVIQAIRAQFPSDKIFTVTPHYVSYALPSQYVGLVDYFPFQIYGPNKPVFLFSTYQDALVRFTAGNRFPKDKIVLSYATTTSRGYDAVSDQVNTGVAPIGVRNGLLDNSYEPHMNSVIDVNGYRRYITGYNQVIDRCEFIHDNDLGGIMYWDMGNDVKTSHPYSLVKAASFSLNSNVDTLITEVDLTPTALHKDMAEQSKLMIYPNPSQTEINIIMPNGQMPSHITLIDLNGIVVRERTNVSSLLVNNIKPGMYLIKAKSKNGQFYQSKIRVD